MFFDEEKDEQKVDEILGETLPISMMQIKELSHGFTLPYKPHPPKIWIHPEQHSTMGEKIQLLCLGIFPIILAFMALIFVMRRKSAMNSQMNSRGNGKGNYTGMSP